MMKFALAIISAILGQALAAVPIGDVKVNSQLGQAIMQYARRLDGEDNINYGWVSDYSIKFQGCHHTLQYNMQADGDDDVKIYNRRLARFRLCPSDSCASDNTYGCSSGAEYIVDMSIFVNSFTEAQMTVRQYNCEYVRENCACDDTDDKDSCASNCYSNAGLSYCVGDEGDDNFNVQNYLECGKLEVDGNNGNGNNGEAQQYYIGPYCSDDGSKILLGVFTEDTCSVEASSGTYEQFNNGVSLPYSSESIVGLECVSCLEDQDQEENNNQDAQDNNQVKYVCEYLYQQAGKCETNLSIDNPSTDACNYIEGVKITRKDGTVVFNKSASRATGAWIGIFAMSTILLGAYVYYLKSKVDRTRSIDY